MNQASKVIPMTPVSSARVQVFEYRNPNATTSRDSTYVTRDTATGAILYRGRSLRQAFHAASIG